MTRRDLEKLCPEKFALIFWSLPFFLGSWVWALPASDGLVHQLRSKACVCGRGQKHFTNCYGACCKSLLACPSWLSLELGEAVRNLSDEKRDVRVQFLAPSARMIFPGGGRPQSLSKKSPPDLKGYRDNRKNLLEHPTRPGLILAKSLGLREQKRTTPCQLGFKLSGGSLPRVLSGPLNRLNASRYLCFAPSTAIGPLLR